MIIIGLTGNIASGKSVVSGFLRELGAEIIDVDKIAKEVQLKNFNGVIDKIKKIFGGEIVVDNKLDRKKLGSIVFSNKDKLEELNEIMVPVLTNIVKKLISKKREQGIKILVVDAAILCEANWDKLVDTVWVVDIPKELQIERLMKRENIDRKEALKRMESQMDISEKIKRADAVIDNSGDLAQMEKRIQNLWRKIQIFT